MCAEVVSQEGMTLTLAPFVSSSIHVSYNVIGKKNCNCNNVHYYVVFRIHTTVVSRTAERFIIWM